MAVSELIILGSSSCTDGYLFVDQSKRFDKSALSLLGVLGSQPYRNRGRGSLRMVDWKRYYIDNTAIPYNAGAATIGPYLAADGNNYGDTAYNSNPVAETQTLNNTILPNSIIYIGNSINDLCNSAATDTVPFSNSIGFPCSVEELTNAYIEFNLYIKALQPGVTTIVGTPTRISGSLTLTTEGIAAIATGYKAYGFDYCLNWHQTMLYSPRDTVNITGTVGDGTNAVYTASTTLETSRWIVGNNVTITGSSNAGFNVANKTITAVLGATFTIANTTLASGTGGSADVASPETQAADGIHGLEAAHVRQGIGLASVLATKGVGVMPTMYLNVLGATDGLASQNAANARGILNQVNAIIGSKTGVNNTTTLHQYGRARWASNNADFYYELPPGVIFQFHQDYLFAGALDKAFRDHGLPNGFMYYVTSTKPFYGTGGWT